MTQNFSLLLLALAEPFACIIAFVAVFLLVSAAFILLLSAALLSYDDIFILSSHLTYDS